MLCHPAFGNVASNPILLFVGFGDLGRAILRQALLSVYAIPGIGVRAICCDAAAEAQDSATRGAPWRQFVDLEFFQHTFGATAAGNWAEIRRHIQEQPPNIVIVTIPNDDTAFQAAIGIRNELDALLRFETPIFVRVRSQLRLGELLTKIVALPFCPYRLVGFGDLGRVVSPDALFDEQLDTMARALHDAYLASSSGDSPARLPWPVLPELYRRSNRAAADHIPVKLNLAGYRMANGKEQLATLDEAAIDCMARAEHYRWCLNLKAAGWTKGEVRSDLLKIHPLLVPWEELPETAKRDNHEQICAIPVALAHVGLRLKRIMQVSPLGEISHDPSILPFFVLDPTDEQDWAVVEVFARQRDCIAMINHVPNLRIETLKDLKEKYPQVAGIITGWRSE
jgi:hypothetical protein